mmetsp:Transcript_16326/g.27600  ORF Transcript_16326/g.27600 Transcript_16326/m.27600 type:complete len:366 (+) Transcript_16326:581-1678(+)
MSQLSQNINIFADSDVIIFLKKEHDSALVAQLSQRFESSLLLRRSLQPLLICPKQGSDDGKDSNSKSPRKITKKMLTKTKSSQLKPSNANQQATMGILRIFSGSNERNLTQEGGALAKNKSASDRQTGSSSEQRDLSKQTVNKSVGSQENWIEKKFETLDEKIISFIEFLHSNPENQSQLVGDFQEFYFESKPVLPNEQIKRLFFGYMRKDGIMALLQSLHEETYSVKTRALLTLFRNLMDYNKCHQVDDFKGVWRQQKPQFVKECKFDAVINNEVSLKESVFILIQAYLEGRMFKAADVLEDQMAIQKYQVWSTCRKNMNKSFISQTQAHKTGSDSKKHPKSSLFSSQNLSSYFVDAHKSKNLR